MSSKKEKWSIEQGSVKSCYLLSSCTGHTGLLACFGKALLPQTFRHDGRWCHCIHRISRWFCCLLRKGSLLEAMRKEHFMQMFLTTCNITNTGEEKLPFSLIYLYYKRTSFVMLQSISDILMLLFCWTLTIHALSWLSQLILGCWWSTAMTALTATSHAAVLSLALSAVAFGIRIDGCSYVPTCYIYMAFSCFNKESIR